LPPVNLTPGEAVAMAVALQRLEGTPFQAAASTALRKVVAAMQRDDVTAAGELARRIHVFGDLDVPSVPHILADALSTRRVLRIGYGDREGATTLREIDPLGYVGKEAHWYLVAWCRLREDLRVFRTDRISSVSITAEVPAPRSLRREDLDIPCGIVDQLTLI
jgi:predicted DNA-binding transcriptional regulator YafY